MIMRLFDIAALKICHPGGVLQVWSVNSLTIPTPIFQSTDELTSDLTMFAHAITLYD
jgi:hypothetical protein